MLYAWSAPDVLIIAMVASILEMELFVTFVIGDKCDGINNILRQYFDKVTPPFQLRNSGRPTAAGSAVEGPLATSSEAHPMFFHAHTPSIYPYR